MYECMGVIMAVLMYGCTGVWMYGCVEILLHGCTRWRLLDRACKASARKLSCRQPRAASRWADVNPACQSVSWSVGRSVSRSVGQSCMLHGVWRISSKR